MRYAIPEGYSSHRCHLGTLLVSQHEKSEHIEFVDSLLKESLMALEGVLGFPDRFRFNVLLLHTVEDAEYCIKRKISNTALLVVESSTESCLIGLFSANANALNADKQRMRRHLLHELTHVWISMQTSSTRSINDKNANLKVPEWMDEGLAEYVSLSLMGRRDELLRLAEDYRRNGGPELYDFYGDDASYAFRAATGRVGVLHGACPVGDRAFAEKARAMLSDACILKMKNPERNGRPGRYSNSGSP